VTRGGWGAGRGVAIALAALVSVALLPWPARAQAAEPQVRLSIGPASSYVDNTGQTHIVGYIHNDGVDVEVARATVELLDGAGKVIGRDTAYAQNATIRPGEISPLDHPFKASSYPGYASFRLRDPIARPGVRLPMRKLKVVVTAVNRTGGGAYTVQGTATNTGAEQMVGGKIQLTFLDDAGVTRWVAGTVAINARNDVVLDPGATANWYIPRREDAPTTWTHYVLTAEDPLFTGDLQPAAASTAGIAPVPRRGVSDAGTTSISHTPLVDAGAVAPSSPLPDTRAPVGVAPASAGAGLTTVAHPRRIEDPLGWGSLILPFGVVLGLLGLVFLVTLSFLAALRLRATSPGPRRA
jgi:hypothetical protein